MKDFLFKPYIYCINLHTQYFFRILLKMKPSIPQGTRDFAPQVVRKRRFILQTITNVLELYGYQPLETPAMENLTTLTGKYGDEGDKLIFKILNNGLHIPEKREKTTAAFDNVLAGKNDTNITERALRYDLTIPFARFVAMNRNDIAFPFKRYQIQPVWRADRPQKGRYREFWQCDADVAGSNSLLNEAELLAIYSESFERLQVPGIAIKINSRKILAGLANICNASEKMTDITVAIDKLDKIGLDGVIKELNENGLTEQQIQIVQSYLAINGSNEEQLEKIKALLQNDDEGKTGITEIQETLQYYQQIRGEKNDVVVDFTLARGLNYYTGIIVEVSTNAVQIGSIGGGGRYDNLTGLFGLQGVSGVGVSFGIDRIYDVMEQLSIFPKQATASTQIMFVNIDPTAENVIFSYLQTLRTNGIAAEYYSDTAKFDKQMKYADKREVPYVGIIGTNELAANKIALKNMTTGEQNLLSIEEVVSLFS